MNIQGYLKIVPALAIALTWFGHGQLAAQWILPTPWKMEKSQSSFSLGDKIIIAYDSIGERTANYLGDKLAGTSLIEIISGTEGNILLASDSTAENLGKEGYILQVDGHGIRITAGDEAGLFYGAQSLLQLLPEEVQAGVAGTLSGYSIPGVKVVDGPKYEWRSFMLDSGRQYHTPSFIKRYLDYMAMLKMNVFHWHLTEGEGWRIEIGTYPKLTSVGSKVAKGKEQQGYYSQEVIRDIVDYAKKLHIEVVPEIDVPGHSQAAMIAYPEFTCFGNIPTNIAGYSTDIPCAGNESTYLFLENVLDEVCGLFPASYIHLGGDEVMRTNWEKCPECQKRIKQEGLRDAHDLQLYFSDRLARYLKTKGKKAIFWGDVLHEDGTELSDNVVITWWNSRKKGDISRKRALERGLPVIANTNQYTYLNFPLTPWQNYNEDRTVDIKMIYEKNASDLPNPDPLVLGMGSCLWTDRNVQMHMLDRRMFPRIYALSEQMWSRGERLPFSTFYERVTERYHLLTLLGIDYGPGLKSEVLEGYSWD